LWAAARRTGTDGLPLTVRVAASTAALVTVWLTALIRASEATAVPLPAVTSRAAVTHRAAASTADLFIVGLTTTPMGTQAVRHRTVTGRVPASPAERQAVNPAARLTTVLVPAREPGQGPGRPCP